MPTPSRFEPTDAIEPIVPVEPAKGPKRRARRGSFVAKLAAMATVCMAIAPLPMAAAAGAATPLLTTKTVNKATAQPGELLTYSINFTCSNNDESGEGCDGAAFSDPLPTFTNVYGETVPLEFVSANFPSGVWSTGSSLDTSVPNAPRVVATAGTWAAGTSGVITIVARIPANQIPAGSQTLSNTATATLGANVSTSPTATTTVTGSTPNWTVFKTGPAANGTTLRRDYGYTWNVSVCAVDAFSAVWNEYTIIDTVPAGFTVTSVEHGGVYLDDNVAPDPADLVSDGAGTITWTFDASHRPPLGSDGCFRMKVNGRFDSSHPSNTPGAAKANTVTGEGSYGGGVPGVPLGTASTNHVLATPGFWGASTSKSFRDASGSSNYYVTDGDTGRYQFSATIDSDYPLDRVVLSDGSWTFTDGDIAPDRSGGGFPDSFTPTSITPGTWNLAIPATIETSADGITWVTAASGVASGAAAIAWPNPAHRHVRWVWDESTDFSGVFSTTGQRVVGTIGTPAATDYGRYTNTSTLEVSPRDQALRTATSSAPYFLESPLPHPGIAKTVSRTTMQPGDQATYTITASNSADATGSLQQPIVTDCVPAHFTVVSTTSTGWTPSVDPTCNAGETPLAFQWSGTLTPGQSATAITITVKAHDHTDGTPIPYTSASVKHINTARIAPGSGGSFRHCVQGPCAASREVTVSPTIQLDSSKCVSGRLDGGIFRPTPRCTSGEAAQAPALTTPGGIIDYRLSLRNVGNVDANNVTFIDILPRVGDTAVITGTPLNQRRTEYRPLLVDEIDVPAGWTVEYSTSANPCRAEVGGPSTGCDTPAWTSTPDPLALSTYRSVRFSYAGTLHFGDDATFEWRMRAPVVDASYDRDGTDADDPQEFLAVCDPLVAYTDDSHCPRAVNSFAYGADADIDPSLKPGRLYAEPPQVEVRVMADPSDNAIGDRVWFDSDFDGVQDDGESGVSDARVELLDSVGNVVGLTFTDADGRYLFTTATDSNGDEISVANGDYRVRFYPPTGYLVSPANATGDPTGADEGSANTDDDSDVDRTPSGTNTNGAYHDTALVHLGGNETDRTWDMGLWRATPGIAIDKVTKDSAWPDSEAGDDVSVIAARPVTWTYRVTNTGNSRLEDITIFDDGGSAVPADGFSVTSCAITDGGHNADGLTSSATAPISLNRGATMVCTATGTTGSSRYENTATVTGTPVTDSGDPVGQPTYYPVPATVTDDDTSSYDVDRYDLALAKVPGVVNLATGETTFTITVANQGTLDSGNYSVTDWLPTGLEFVSASPNPSAESGDSTVGHELRWDLSGLTPGGSRTITVDARIVDYLAGPFRNVAEISADGAADVVTGGVSTPTADVDSTPDANPMNDGAYGPVGGSPAIDNSSIADAGTGADAPPLGEDDADIADLVPGVVYDLGLAKVASVVPPTLEDAATITWSITVANQGNVPSGNFTVTDHLPAGLAVSDPSTGVVTNGDGTTTVTLAGTNLAPGATRTWTITTTVTEPGLRPFRNIAEISADSAQALYGVDDIDSTPDLDPNNDGDYGPIGNVDPAVDNIDVAEAGVADDPEDDADVAEVTFPVTYDLALSKTVDRAVVNPADTVTYSVTVQNQGMLPSREFTVEDLVPEGMSVVPGSVSHDGVTSGGVVEWTIDNLNPGQSLVLTFSTKIVDLTKRPYRNVAEITSDSAATWDIDGDVVADIDSTPDNDPTNDGDYGPVGNSDPAVDNASIADAGLGADPEDDADVADVDVEVRYDLALIKTVDSPTVAYDGTAVFTIAVRNQGNVASGPYTVTDLVPTGLDVVAASHGGIVSGDGRIVTWSDLDSIEPGETATVTVSVKVGDITTRPWRNVAEITEDGSDAYSTVDQPIADIDSVPGDPEGSDADNVSFDQAGEGDDVGFDDEDVADLTVEVVYDLEIAKRLVPGQTYRAGGTVLYEITVANEGNVSSGPVSFVDVLPKGLEFVSASHGGVFTDSGGDNAGVVTWTDVESILPGKALVVTVTTTLADATLKQYRNWAQITADGADGYSTPSSKVTDVDSAPNNGDVGVLGEDDTADASIPVDEIVKSDSTERGSQVPERLGFTGSTTGVLVALAAAFIGAGVAITIAQRRRRTA
ncbi:MAG: SdrD B-like domain-containing protein [Microthrixaceae bacterium]